MTIKFERLGNDNKDLGDIGNYRIMSEKFENKKGHETILQVGLNHNIFRKKGKKCIYVQIFIYLENDACVGDYEFEKEVFDAEIEYNKENALKLVNRLSKENFEKIEII